MQICLVDPVVLGANVELISLVFWELHRVDPRKAVVISTLHLVEKIETNLWVRKFTEVPQAQLGVSRDTHDVVRILVTDDLQGVDWVVVSVFGEG
jgi:hypothetical protein